MNNSIVVGFPLYNQQFVINEHLGLGNYLSVAQKVPDLLIDTSEDSLFVKYGQDECQIQVRIRPGLPVHWIDNTLSLPSDDRRTYLLNIVGHLPTFLPDVAGLNPLSVMNSLTNKAGEVIGLWPFKGVVKGLCDVTLESSHHV